MAFEIGKEFWLKENVGIGEKDAYQSLTGLISLILPNIFVLAGLILFLLLLSGGIMIIAGGNQDNPEAAAKGKKAVTSAVVGFLIIFLSYWIMKLIQALTGVPILTGLEN